MVDRPDEFGEASLSTYKIEAALFRSKSNNAVRKALRPSILFKHARNKPIEKIVVAVMSRRFMFDPLI